MISTPEAPDPAETAAAQADLNLETATQQQLINMVDQVTPYGNLDYEQTGQNWYQDSDGNWVSTPAFTATTTLSPEQQSILNETNAASLNLAKLANQQSGFLGDYLGKSIDLSGAPELQTSSGLQTSLGPGWQTSYQGADDFSADRQAVTDSLLARMSPQQEQDAAKLRTQLINQGIRPGTAAWDAEWNRNQQGVNDARLAAILAGGEEQQRMVDMARQAAEFNNAAIGTRFGLENNAALQDATFGNNARSQYLNEAYAERANPINEISALLSGSQVQNPSFAQTPQAGVEGVDYTGLVNQQYQSELQASQAAMGGLFGLLAAPFMAFSDIRLKDNIRRVGQTDGGTPIYAFTYKWGGPMQLGVMAHEVPEDARVMDESGFWKVDYRKVH